LINAKAKREKEQKTKAITGWCMSHLKHQAEARQNTLVPSHKIRMMDRAPSIDEIHYKLGI